MHSVARSIAPGRAEKTLRRKSPALVPLCDAIGCDVVTFVGGENPKMLRNSNGSEPARSLHARHAPFPPPHSRAAFAFFLHFVLYFRYFFLFASLAYSFVDRSAPIFVNVCATRAEESEPVAHQKPSAPIAETISFVRCRRSVFLGRFQPIRAESPRYRQEP